VAEEERRRQSLMFTYVRTVLAILELAKKLVSLGERHMWIDEGERRVIQRELEAVLKALKKKDKVHAEVDKIPDDFLDTELAADGDLRPDERLPQ
jgi:hypothetical protein